jgi:hypothetical protein
MKDFKAPGPDGYHPVFFKTQWDILGVSMHNFVNLCFSQPTMTHSVNQTLLTLIPKCDDPSKISQFRPIALCNVVYKVLTKIISNRLRTFLPSVISENQSSFIPGRSTIDNIIVLQETIHSLNRLQGKKSFMIIKLDLEKAYDRLEWSFVMDTLVHLGIPQELQNLIFHCISSASMNINWNGNMTESFNQGRGLRQGDPLSPYLFVLCIERLGHMIKDAVSAGEWAPYSFGRGDCPKLSHICFADDLILVAEATEAQVGCVNKVLHEFCQKSGQKINLLKSQVFFSKNTPESQTTTLSHALGVHVTQDLGMYLGAPMIHQRISKQSFAYLLDKMRKKLSGWKAKTLSFAGRVTLAQTSLVNIPGYVLQCTPIPVSVCEDVEQICRNFIWGTTAEARKTHLIAWDKLCHPKSEGGLGFRNLKMLNKAHMMKLSWQILTQPSKLWVKILKAKYKCGMNIIPNFKHASNSSPLWRAIVNAWDDVKGNITRVIRDGVDTHF